MKIQTFCCLGLALVLVCGHLSAQEVTPYLLRATETYGDPMGESKSLSHRVTTYYDAFGRPVRAADYGFGLDGTATLCRYSYYEYDDGGRLVLTYSRQYGIYDGDDYAFREPTDSVRYTYDAEGRLVDRQGDGHRTYAYDAKGRLAVETYYTVDWFSGAERECQTLTYTDFDAAGRPTTAVSTGLYDSYRYTACFTYDAAGRLRSEVRTSSVDRWNAAGEVYHDFLGADYWDYDEATGRLTGQRRSGVAYVEDGPDTEVTDYYRIVYTSDGAHRTKAVPQNWTVKASLAEGGAWVDEPVYTIADSARYSSAAAPALQVRADSDVPGRVELRFWPQTATPPASYDFLVYRRGLLRARLDGSQLQADAADGSLCFTDCPVPNGGHEYFVQPVLRSAPDWQGTSISNVCPLTLATPLPAPTGLRAVGYTPKGSGYLVRLSWDAPVDTLGLGFRRYNVMVGAAPRVADNYATDGLSTSWDVLVYSLTSPLICYVQAVYDLGKAATEVVSIVPGELSDITGLQMAETAPLVGLQCSADGWLTAGGEPLGLEVRTTDGRLVLRAAGSARLSLGSLPRGVYVATTRYADGSRCARRIVR